MEALHLHNDDGHYGLLGLLEWLHYFPLPQVLRHDRLELQCDHQCLRLSLLHHGRLLPRANLRLVGKVLHAVLCRSNHPSRSWLVPPQRNDVLLWRFQRLRAEGHTCYACIRQGYKTDPRTALPYEHYHNRTRLWLHLIRGNLRRVQLPN